MIEKKIKMTTTEKDKWKLLRARLNRIKASKVFEISIITVIVVSAIAVGAHSYSLSPQTIKILAILEYIISAIFCVEIGVRILAEEKFSDFFRSGWNVFDFTIVAVSLIPIGNAQVVWVARLVRIFRVLRLISYVPQLRIIIDTLGRAIPRIGYVVLLMFILFYMYGTLGNMFFGKINPFLWGNVSISMLTLFRIVSLEDWTDVMYINMYGADNYGYSDSDIATWKPVPSASPLGAAFYFVSFVLIGTMVVLNLVIGVIMNSMEEMNSEMALNERMKKRLELPDPVREGIEDLQDRLDELVEEMQVVKAMLEKNKTG